MDLPPKNSILKIRPALAVVSQITVTLGVVILYPLSQLRRLCTRRSALGEWPWSGLWFLRLAVGVSLILRGWSCIMFALAIRSIPLSTEVRRAA